MIRPTLHRLAPYAPLTWQIAPLRDKSLVVLMTGSAGGGKSRCAAEKGHAFNLKYPGATGLIVRKTREAANISCVPMMWETVMGKERSGVQWRKDNNSFYYPNGSMIFTGGLKDEGQREAIRSIGGKGALDWIWVEEANKITEEDFNELLARLRGKAANWLQIILTTNPDAPAHWINQRLIVGGGAHVYYSGAKDNPHNPPEYVKNLELLTGTQYQRLVKGLWVQAEGVIFDNFTVEDNVGERAEYNPDWPVVWCVDDGYAAGKGKGTESYHPRVFLLAQFTPQGGINVFYEYYRVLELQDISLTNVLALPYPRPDIAYVDSAAAELRGRIWGHGIQTFGGTHPVTEGIKNLRRLICDGQGQRLLTIHPRCVNLIEEMQSYSTGDNVTAHAGEIVPEKINDHGPSALRYGTWQLRFE